MKQTLTTILIIATVGLMLTGIISCRKNTTSPDIKTYDQQQITNYLQVNNLTGYSRDLTGGDTSGIYYKITKTGSGNALDYSDQVFFIYTVRTLDGAYIAGDTTINHAYNFVGHLSPAYTTISSSPLPYVLPAGLQIAFKNILKYRGAQGHVIIPSHLAFGTAGIGAGSNRITGNESLDYYINIVDPAQQPAYDDALIQLYMTNNGLSGFTKTASGLYYKVTQQGYKTPGVTSNSTIVAQYTGKLMNNNVFDSKTATDSSGTSFYYGSLLKGVQEGFQYVTKGAQISLILPSKLAYGLTPPSGITPNSCLYFDFTIENITN